MIKKVLYVHYLNTPKDGANTHVTEFRKSFGKICERDGIEFKTIAPEPSLGIHKPPSKLKIVKDWIGKFWIRDIKIILEQYKHYRVEKAILEREKPDIVLARWNARNVSIFYAARSLGIPVCVEINGSDTEKSDGDFFIRFPPVERALKNRNLVRLVDGAFVVSGVLQKEIKDQIDFEKDIRVIPNGVDVNRFEENISGQAIREKLGISEDKVVVGYIGTFAPWHRLDKLLEIYQDLSKKYDNIHILLIGETYPHAQGLIKLVEEKGLKQHVTFTGHVDMQQVPNYVAAMDIAVLPHTAYYCSPLKLFEYMALKRAIVSIGTEPVKEMMSENEGITFKPGDMQSMENAIERLIDNAELRKQLGENARERIKNEFTWDINAEKVYGLLKDTYTRVTGKPAR